MNGTDLAGVQWRKSRHSNGQAECVEVGTVWRKSRHSNGQGNCVEVAAGGEERRVVVRDSKDPGGPVLLVSPEDWRGLLARVRAGA